MLWKKTRVVPPVLSSPAGGKDPAAPDHGQKSYLDGAMSHIRRGYGPGGMCKRRGTPGRRSGRSESVPTESVNERKSRVRRLFDAPSVPAQT